MVSFHVFCFYVPPQHFSFEHGAFYHCIFAAVQIEGIRVAGCGGEGSCTGNGVITESESCRTFGIV